MVEGLGGGGGSAAEDEQRAVAEEDGMTDMWDLQTDADGQKILLACPSNQTRNETAPSLQPNTCIGAISF